MEHCLARQEGVIDKAVTDTACISLASFGDGYASQNGKENIARNSLLLWILVAFSSILRLCEHLASLPPQAKFQNSLYLVTCYTNLVADCDVTFIALLEDGWKCSPTAVSLA